MLGAQRASTPTLSLPRPPPLPVCWLGVVLGTAHPATPAAVRNARRRNTVTGPRPGGMGYGYAGKELAPLVRCRRRAPPASGVPLLLGSARRRRSSLYTAEARLAPSPRVVPYGRGKGAFAVCSSPLPASASQAPPPPKCIGSAMNCTFHACNVRVRTFTLGLPENNGRLRLTGSGAPPLAPRKPLFLTPKKVLDRQKDGKFPLSIGKHQQYPTIPHTHTHTQPASNGIGCTRQSNNAPQHAVEHPPEATKKATEKQLRQSSHSPHPNIRLTNRQLGWMNTRRAPTNPSSMLAHLQNHPP